MLSQSVSENTRVVAGIPFVEQLARRVAATMPHSIDIGDLVQDGVIGLIDAANRFDEARGIKFETFAERRIRGAMIDALRKDAWPRGVRRQRRELEAARETLRRELGCEPSLADHIRVSYVGEEPGPALAFKTKYDAATRAVQITFAAPLAPFRTVKVELSSDILAFDGAPLKPWSLTFSVGR